MHWKPLLTVVLALLPWRAGAAPEDARPPLVGGTPLFTDADCAVIACRPVGGNFVIHTKEGNDTNFPIPPWPYATKDGTIIIFPGETLTVNFPQMAETPGLPHYLGGLAEPGATNNLTISYKYETIGGKISSFLALRQTSPQSMKLDAQISVFSPQGLKFQASSTCPLRTKLLGVESWPGELGPILLHDIHFLANNASMACT